MKSNLSKIGLYIGLGAGLVIFVIGGLLPGSFLGGSIGVTITKNLLGGSLETSLLQRLIVGASMLSGIFVAGLFLLIGTSSLGWLTDSFLGFVIDTVRSGSTAGTIKNETAVDSN